MKFFINYIPCILCYIAFNAANAVNLPTTTENNLLKPSGYAIASAHPLATEAGLKIMAQGGNAFDAAIAVSAALAVVEPYHSGLGGGGFWLLYQASTNKNFLIDGRERAPKAANKNMFLDVNGEPIIGLSINGGLAAAIPGEPAALVKIAQQFGKLPLKISLAPAINLAKNGFNIDAQFYRCINMQDRFFQLSKFESSKNVFLKENATYKIGDLFIQKDLANTLEILANEGHDGFYKGKVAKLLVDGVNKAGGIWTLEDLATYEVKIREPLIYNYKQMQIITTPLPSAGGILLVMMLKLLAEYPLQTMTKVEFIHYLTEVMRLSFWQRKECLGDTDFVNVAIDKLLSENNLKYLQSFIKKDKATPSNNLQAKGEDDKANGNTTHFSILDKEGNRVAATLSINYIFGSSVVADGTGVLLNDEMDDFSIKPGNVSNVFGLLGGNKNAIEPYKRPLSNMAPTFLILPDNIAILGTPGGSRIPTMMLLAALKFYETYNAISMIGTLRFHHQYTPDWLQFEPNAINLTEQNALKAMGYNLMGLQSYYGDMQIITWDKKNNLITAASDPRKMGMSAVVTENLKYGYGLMY